MKHLHLALSLISLLFTLPACAGDHVRWTEEVKLSDGKVIQLQRHVELTSSGFPLQHRGFDKFHEICYPPMNIHWKSKSGYQPDIFDIVDGKAYMHVPIGACVQCRETGDPSPNALYFRWDNGQWQRISHEEFPAAAEWNLVMKTSGGSRSTDPQGLITLAQKASGKWDGTLLYLQKRDGWKRVNEGFSWLDACMKCGRNNSNSIPTSPIEIFIHDGKSDCQP